MDIRLVPYITIQPISDQKPNNINKKGKFRLKGKIVEIRKSRANEKSKYTIIITIDEEIQNKNILINQPVIIISDN